ncbi:SMR family transporter [Helicobacter sp. MIT 14-3879]|uniref:SMR family transporter n=1 Tax=Helicobacter sp. MIT 14-3879 TaxID=2040649 RepID=UPI000E1F97DF|nr:multidrug efflux SMR transporter [Helicobacter sp. MIT 14-3879]RDU62424.1 QacE family quaternary ammonium compound efflux SMR transporter [Helicobacter sp. MIT 14-3879]
MKLYLFIIIFSALLDISANLLLKKSNGFRNKKYGILAIILACIAFCLLSFSLKYIELSIAYSTWGAIGILGTCIGGYVFYKEKLNYIGIFGIIITICSVIILNLG